MVNKLDPSKICRDPSVCSHYDNDPLCHDTGTLEGLAGMLERAQNLEELKLLVPEGVGEGGKTRLWIGHGTGDQICDYRSAKKYYEACEVEDKEMRLYEGWYHQLHCEPGEDKVRFRRDVVKWILDRCPEVGGQSGVKAKEEDAVGAAERSKL